MLKIQQFKNEADSTSYDFAISYEGNENKPALFGLIRLSSKKASDLSRAVGIVSDFIVDKFRESELSLLSRLGSLQRDAVDLISSVPIDEDEEIDFCLGLVAIHNDTFYVYFEQPYFNVYVIRNDKVIQINKGSPATMFTGSGKTQYGDEIIVATENFELEKYLSDKDYKLKNSASISIKYKENIEEAPKLEPILPAVSFDSPQEKFIEKEMPIEEEAIDEDTQEAQIEEQKINDPEFAQHAEELEQEFVQQEEENSNVEEQAETLEGRANPFSNFKKKFLKPANRLPRRGEPVGFTAKLQAFMAEGRNQE